MDEAAVRVGDSERWAVDARLQEAVGAGRLTLAEYEERSGEVWAARTRGELEALATDLPPAVPAPRQAEPGSVALPSRTTTTRAVLGSSTLDLRRADLPPEVDVRATAVLGSVEVLVPRGAAVHLSGSSLLGARTTDLEPPRPGAPVVHVHGTAVLGAVEVRHGSGEAGGQVAVAPRHTRGHSPRGWLVRAVLVGAVAFGAVSSVSADSTTVFGSRTVSVQQGDEVSVGTVFGSTTVVVPDGSAVDVGGAMVFGSTECDACSPGPGTAPSATGAPVTVKARGAFGSVEIVTRSQYEQQQADGERGD